MRRSHPSRQLKSLSFAVTTTEFKGDSEIVTRARAIAALPGKLRVVEIPTSRKSGYVRDRQTFVVFEKGKRVARSSRIDIAQLLAYDLFAQGTDTTIKWLDDSRMRFGLAQRTELKGKRAWLVGADGDSTSTRFWVDGDQWRVLRVLQRDPLARNQMLDIWFTEFTDVEDVPVPVRIEIFRNGRLEQRLEMTEVEANPTVPARAFDTSRWRDVRI
jgi:outer membrane lipoprotein-sorting protein